MKNPRFVLPGILGRYPIWAGGSRRSALALLAANGQNQQATLMIPFDLARVAMGYAL